MDCSLAPHTESKHKYQKFISPNFMKKDSSRRVLPKQAQVLTKNRSETKILPKNILDTNLLSTNDSALDIYDKPSQPNIQRGKYNLNLEEISRSVET